MVEPPPAKDDKYVFNPELGEKPLAGKKIRIDKLYFQADSSRINREAFPILDEVVAFMRSNPGITIEIAGHTNSRCGTEFCNELSESRAKAVVDYLSSRGVPPARMQYRGYGKTDPIASDDTVDGRRKNQRVEIRILKMSG